MNAPAIAPTASALITVNEEPRSLARGATVASLIAELGWADRKGIAIAVNGGVVPRRAWPDHGLVEGDRVLVIKATQGG
jgi:sulfur carrier protein